MIALFVSAAFGADVPAPPTLDLQRWTLPVDSRGTFWTQDATDAPPGWATAGIVASWQHDPVIYATSDGGVRPVVANAFTTSAQGAFSFGRGLVGVEVPLLLGVRGEAFDTAAALGEIGLSAKGIVLTHQSPVHLAALAGVWFPTSGLTGAPWASTEVRWQVGVAADADAGPVALALDLLTKGQPHADFGAGLVLDDAFAGRFGAAWPVSRRFTLGADLAADLPYATPLSTIGATSLEAMLGGTFHAGPWDVRLAAGRGFTDGLGAPDARLIAGVAWVPPRAWDRDGDGLVDTADACPRDPEDKDAFQDEDGCPDLDDDQDGLADTVDQCPRNAEDRDGWQDGDGCPDPTTQVILRAVDTAGKPVQTAAVSLRIGDASITGTGTAEGDLAPGPGRAHGEADGFLPTDLPVEVVNGPPQALVVQLAPVPLGTVTLRVVDPKGVPIPTATWRAGHRDLPPMTNGAGTTSLPAGITAIDVSAPDYVPARLPASVEAGKTLSLSVTLRPARIKVTREKLVFTDKIYFDTNRATIKPASFPLLDEIVATLRARDDIVLVRIEGHTDTRGDNALNQTLSDNRAASVRAYLIEHGIDASRLTSIGYGETRPVDDREVPAAWDKNRRVEFFIERWAE